MKFNTIIVATIVAFAATAAAAPSVKFSGGADRFEGVEGREAGFGPSSDATEAQYFDKRAAAAAFPERTNGWQDIPGRKVVGYGPSPDETQDEYLDKRAAAAAFPERTNGWQDIPGRKVVGYGPSPNEVEA